MATVIIADIVDAGRAVWQFLAQPIADTPWTQWRDFWLRQVCEDRFVVLYFLPLVLVLLLLTRSARAGGPQYRGDRLRVGIVLTGLAFVAYVFGAPYAGFWLLSCLAFHRLGERFAIECRRTDVFPIGPPLAAGLIIGGWYFGTQLLQAAVLPAALNAWLATHAAWLFPLGARGVAWEPRFAFLHDPRNPVGPFPLLHAMFYHAHAIGTAYLTVRLLCYFSDIKRGTLPAQRRTLLNFLAYACYAPALIQGPLERFAVFQDEMDTCHERRSWWNLPAATGRIALGLGKNLVATWYVKPVSMGYLGLHDGLLYQHPEQIESFALLYFGPFLQLLHLYLEFSGYCDVSAGIARLIGYRQIENFDWPWLATSMRDLWRRWHISLSSILRDYLYIPLGGNRRHTTLNLCVTFALCGLWHVPVPKWAIWGLVMGLMVAANQHWVQWMKRLDQTPDSRWARVRRSWLRLHPLPRVCAWAITMHAFVFSTTIFAGGRGALNLWREILRRVWEAL